ncbi:hypothetical protein CYMTET_9472 [Cymbomonas tetramitiformis]|uniref:HAT C-terminal dimerisation domain-containing protein n=1 Tax=Cymbomonas tetramitiformis TaxID=36881 RepID=A0AAE0GR78_9CHLO|nr:hypothetical protein CYMTET_9472 [Cymbomonas tetramitiformis]
MRSGWGGAFKQVNWFIENEAAIQLYDIENPRKAATAAPNPDGNVYRDHKQVDVEWDILRESRAILASARTCVDLLQGTKYVTSSLVLPLIGHLAYKLHKDTAVKFEGELAPILNEDVKAAREILHKDICKRYFNDFMDCKLEDFCVATFLDPRCKHFTFKYVTRWARGTLTAERAKAWAKGAWDGDWKPKPLEVDAVVVTPSIQTRKVGKPSVASFLDDSDEEEMLEPDELSADTFPSSTASDDFSKYMALPVASGDVNPSDWWRVHGAILPDLAKMARQFLAAPANTAGVERAFSAYAS